MDRRGIRKFAAILFISILLLSGCEMREEIGEGGSIDGNADVFPQTSVSGRGEETAVTDSGIDSAWRIYEAAIEKTDSADALEINQLIYTKKTDTEESISLHLCMTGIGTEAMAVQADGSVNSDGDVMSVGISYYDGRRLSTGAQSEKLEETDEDTVLSEVVFLRGFHRDMCRSFMTDASYESSADGMVTLSFTFEGMINDVFTSGNGEIMINSDGLLASEGYSFEVTDSDGMRSTQSVECVLLAVNDDVSAIEIPEKLLAED